MAEPRAITLDDARRLYNNVSEALDALTLNGKNAPSFDYVAVMIRDELQHLFSAVVDA